MSVVIIIDAVERAFGRLKTEEGFRAKEYKDTQGNSTIGYGFNIDAGITQRAAAALLVEQLHEVHEGLVKLPWYAGLDTARQSVCLDIAVNEGLHGLLKFHRMITFLEDKDWVNAAKECEVEDNKLDNSRYAPLRQILLKGEG